MLARTPAPWTSRTGPRVGVPLAADVDEVQFEPVTRLERDEASIVTFVGVVRIGDDHGSRLARGSPTFNWYSADPGGAASTGAARGRAALPG